MRYDITLKELFHELPPGLLRQLVGQEVAELLNVEFPTAQMRKPDFVARLADGTLYHLDLQSDNDAGMEWRMLQYYFLLYRVYGEIPVQQVLYVGAAAMKMNHRISHPRLQYEYGLVDIRTLHGTELLASPSITDNIFAMLCDHPDAHTAIREILNKLAVCDENLRQDFFSKMSILSDLRGLGKPLSQEVAAMPVVFNLRENPIFVRYFDEAENKGRTEGRTEGRAEGRAEGRSQGIEQGVRRTLRHQLERRFGLIPLLVVDRLEDASLSELETWSERVLDAKSLQDVFAETIN